mmetsp:Transcript_22562/g.32223  ORF Transcript_22562/g.32223 Transcript_22562/m.32223 type:complete len:209 (+) Transcript_22562:118-744(+)
MMMLSPLDHRRRRRAVIVVCSLLSCTCAISTAFSPSTQLSLPSIHTSSSSPTAASTPHSSINLSNHHSNSRSTTSTQLHLFNNSSSNKEKKNHKKKNSPLEDEPWKKDDSYWDQLQAASKDPQQFEKFIEDTMVKKNISSSSSSSSYTPQKAEQETPKKKGAYVPIEEWDAQRSKENMTSEERLQWECQRGGNQLRQNDILMHNLKSF